MKDIQALKKEHGEDNVYQGTLKTRKGEAVEVFFRFPDDDEMSAASRFLGTNQFEFGKSLASKCLIGGDITIEELRSNTFLMVQASSIIQTILPFVESDLKNV